MPDSYNSKVYIKPLNLSHKLSICFLVHALKLPVHTTGRDRPPRSDSVTNQVYGVRAMVEMSTLDTEYLVPVKLLLPSLWAM